MPFTGILFSNGKTWKEQRTFAQKTVKEICFEDGSKNIETVLREEVEKVLQKMDEFGTDPSEIQRLVQTYSLNVIIRIVYGDGFKGENENASYLIDAYHNIGMEVATMQVMVNCFPFLHSLPGDILGLKKFELKRQKLESVTKHFIQNSLNNNESCNKSFVEMYNVELERCKSGDKDTGDSFSERRMIHSCSDLIGAGSDTTANAIVWILLHLVREPEVQEKMFQEMTQQLGEKTEPMLSDRKSLPYAQAVILEGLRISNSTPLALPHSVSENLYFKKYFFPKDCTVLVNLASVLKDPEFFKDPNIFKPERFLSKDGSRVIDVDGFVPFSVGPRSCLGESLARMQLFLVVSSIVRRFKLLPEIDGQLPVAQGQLSTVYKPLPFLIRLLKR
jgi:cytochrome P450